MKIDWGTQARFNGDSPEARFMVRLREEFENSLNRLIDNNRSALGDFRIPRNERYKPTPLYSIILDYLNEMQILGEGLPSRAAFAAIWTGGAGGSVVRRALQTVEADFDVTDQLVSEYLRHFKKAKPDSKLADPRIANDTTVLLAQVRDHRLEWDAAPAGSGLYRDPMKSLPDVNPDLLSAAYMLAIGPGSPAGLELSEEDVAYCLFSACKHGRLWRDWVVLCAESKSAAAAMVDMMGWRNWVRPSLRAAWCLTQLDRQLVERARDFVRVRYSESTDGTLELTEAAANGSLVSHVQTLVDQRYWGAETSEAEIFLTEIDAGPPRRGARGMFD